MVAVRAIVLLLLLAAAGCFAAFAWTGEPRWKRLGLVILKWTLLAALGFFGVLALQRVFE